MGCLPLFSTNFSLISHPCNTTISCIYCYATYLYLVYCYISPTSCIYISFYLFYHTISCGLCLLLTRSPLPPLRTAYTAHSISTISCIYVYISTLYLVYALYLVLYLLLYYCILHFTSPLRPSSQYLVVLSIYYAYLLQYLVLAPQPSSSPTISCILHSFAGTAYSKHSSGARVAVSRALRSIPV